MSHATRMQDMPAHLEHARRCLIRRLLALRAERGDEWFVDYVAKMPAWPTLGADYNEQWRLGNRGAPNDWRTP